MQQELLRKLKAWRADQAAKTGVDLFRVLQTGAVEEIVRNLPTTREALMEIKGIKEKKFAQYGSAILQMVKEAKEGGGSVGMETEDTPKSDDAVQKKYTVSTYMDALNNLLIRSQAHVQGEISSLSIRGSYLFFGLKDKADDSVLQCFMWARDYKISGVEFEEGMEVILSGVSEMYKPTGRLTFRAQTAELVGEGALKKAYLDLKKKLEKEGIFAEENKKPIPAFPVRIGLVTSRTGAVINDFLNNLGKFGYQIRFVHSRVEGQASVLDLLSAIDRLEKEKLDVLVIIRGGGSLESLQAFNNEVLIRKISSLETPVICGIGHDKDVSLAALAADLMTSTPTAITTVLNKSWERVVQDLHMLENNIMTRYERSLAQTTYRFETLSVRLSEELNTALRHIDELVHGLKNALRGIGFQIQKTKERIQTVESSLLEKLSRRFVILRERMHTIEQMLELVNPLRQLKRGYALVSSGGSVVRSVKDIALGSTVVIELADGKMESKVTKKNI